METSQVINIIFYVLLIIGFLSYQIWLGSELVKARKKIVSNAVEMTWTSDGIYRSIGETVKDLHKDTDRLDSRLDARINEVERNLTTHVCSTKRDLQEAINELVEDVDKLNNK
jgi:polyhydroxyalkanoate synthesis regulator phasin